MGVVLVGRLVRAELSRRWLRVMLAVVVAVPVAIALLHEFSVSPVPEFPNGFELFATRMLSLGMVASMVSSAELVAGARELRMVESLQLSKVRPGRFASSSWAVGACLGVGGALIATALFVGILAGINEVGLFSADAWRHDPDVSRMGRDALMILVGCLAGAGVGVLVGSYSRSGVAAVAFGACLMVGMQALSFFTAVSPVLNGLWVVLPLGAADQLESHTSLSSVDLRAALAALALYAGVLPLLGATQVAESLVVRGDRKKNLRRRRGAKVRLVTATTCLLGVGLVLPVALRDLLPWYLSPLWLEQSAGHRTSKDVARRFIAAAQAGRDAADTHLPGTTTSGLLGPYLGYVRHSRHISVSVTESLDWNPADVQITPQKGPLFDLCLSFNNG
ncbi:MAG: hypothetical protein ACRDPG_06840, partial [Nocardioidaceae bacterium]